MVRKSNIVSVGARGGLKEGGEVGWGSPPITTTPYPGPHLLRSQTWSFQMKSRPPLLPAPSEPPLLHISECTLSRQKSARSDRKSC